MKFLGWVQPPKMKILKIGMIFGESNQHFLKKMWKLDIVEHMRTFSILE